MRNGKIVTYQIVNIRNMKRYIGESTNIVNRILSHFQSLSSGHHPNLRLQEDYNKFGRGAFDLSVLKRIECSVEHWLENDPWADGPLWKYIVTSEQHYISKYYMSTGVYNKVYASDRYYKKDLDFLDDIDREKTSEIKSAILSRGDDYLATIKRNLLKRNGEWLLNFEGKTNWMNTEEIV